MITSRTTLAIALLPAIALTMAACSKTSDANATGGPGADLIISGGPIVTMEGDQPTTAEAIVVDDGTIVFVGSKADAMKQKVASTVIKDLGGNTLMPGFIDGHAHGQQFGTQAVGANLLAPPDGEVNSIDDIIAKLETFAAGPDVKRTGWIFGIGYDDALLGRHPTRADLDKVSTTVPVMATHISGHFAAVNTLGLKMIGYDATSKNPEGGVIRREADGKTPNGVLEELAAMPHMVKSLAPVDQAGRDDFLKRGMEMAKSYGYTTVNEGRMFGNMHKEMENAANRGLLDIDFTGWMDYSNKAEIDRSFAKTYTNRYRLAGLKVTLDGSPQGRTAWRTIPYLVPPDGQKSGYKGYPAIPDTAQVQAYLDEAYAKGWPVKVHANGDAAIDQLFTALRPVVAKYGVKPGQTILIHGQFIRADQIPELKKLGIFPSMFPMHTFYWGDWYPVIIGPEKAETISPMRSILDTGLHATSHTDAPVALPNLMQVVWATVNRTSRSGVIRGPNERVTPHEAMKMITIWGAEQFGEADSKGSIKTGKRADLVVLSDNRQLYELCAAFGVSILAGLSDGTVVPTEVHFMHDAPADLAPYQRIFGAPLRFNQPQCCMILPGHGVDRIRTASDPERRRRVEATINAALTRDDPVLRLQRLLRLQLFEDDASMRGAAAAMGMPVRTLRRKLAAQDTTFEIVRDEVRFMAARELLDMTRLPITEIATALAFASHSAFDQTFRRWSGVSPSEWRRGLAGGLSASG